MCAGIDNTAVRASQVARLQKMKRDRNEVEVKKALESLSAAAARFNQAQKKSDSRIMHTEKQDDNDNLLFLAVHAARVRCSLGEISAALETHW